MCAQLGRHGNGGAEEEDDVEGVEDDWDDRVAGEAVVEGDRNQVEEGEHAEGGYEHIVVDHRRVARKGACDDVAHQGHDEKGEEELRSSKSAAETGAAQAGEGQRRENYLQPSKNEVHCA